MTATKQCILGYFGVIKVLRVLWRCEFVSTNKCIPIGTRVFSSSSRSTAVHTQTDTKRERRARALGSPHTVLVRRRLKVWTSAGDWIATATRTDSVLRTRVTKANKPACAEKEATEICIKAWNNELSGVGGLAQWAPSPRRALGSRWGAAGRRCPRAHGSAKALAGPSCSPRLSSPKRPWLRAGYLIRLVRGAQKHFWQW